MELIFAANAPVSNDELNELRRSSWGGVQDADWTSMFERAFGWVTARVEGRLVGFVRLLWDGDVHMFLLDTTVHPDFGRRGIGTELVRRAVELAKSSNSEWLHVDFGPELEPFYAGAGFRSTPAGLIRLS